MRERVGRGDNVGINHGQALIDWLPNHFRLATLVHLDLLTQLSLYKGNSKWKYFKDFFILTLWCN